jgi:hypothetical protein
MKVDNQPEIRLENPQSGNFRTFIYANSLNCDNVVEQDSMKGKTLAICGAGPSLAECASEHLPKADVIWGCNSAGPWLLKHGFKVDAFYSVDQTPELIEEWVSAPDVEYILASSVHPNLVEYLKSKDRRISFHHNFVGVQERPVSFAACLDCGVTPDADTLVCPQCQSTNIVTRTESYEDWLYMALYPGTVRAGSGLNTVTRAVDVAFFMGFDKVMVLGSDCCLKVLNPRPETAVQGTAEYLDWLRKETVMHADGGSALASNASPLTFEATIDPGTHGMNVRPGKGKHFVSKIDLIVSAIWLVMMERDSKGRLEVVGDGLVPALRKKSKSYLRRLPGGSMAELVLGKAA